jgi:uncharacterized protein YcfJ
LRHGDETGDFEIMRTFMAALLAAASLSAPILASAQNGYPDHGAAYAQNPPPAPAYDHRVVHHRVVHHRRYRHYADNRYRCERYRRDRANTGTAVGAVSGGILGSALGGGRFGNVLLGAGAGALAGHEIAKGGVRC